MSEMRWVITEDLIEDVELHSRIGYGNFPIARKEELPYEFKLFDDDRVHYYTGRCDNPGQFDESEAFAPLDWAMNDSGCTIMQYRKANTHDQWEDL